MKKSCVPQNPISSESHFCPNHAPPHANAPRGTPPFFLFWFQLRWTPLIFNLTQSPEASTSKASEGILAPYLKAFENKIWHLSLIECMNMYIQQMYTNLKWISAPVLITNFLFPPATVIHVSSNICCSIILSMQRMKLTAISWPERLTCVHGSDASSCISMLLEYELPQNFSSKGIDTCH